MVKGAQEPRRAPDHARQNVLSVLAQRGVRPVKYDGNGHPDTRYVDGRGRPASRRDGSDALSG